MNTETTRPRKPVLIKAGFQFHDWVFGNIFDKMTDVMPLRVNHRNRVQFRKKKKRSLKPIAIIFVLLTLGIAGYIWMGQNNFRKSDEEKAEVKAIENIFKPEPKKPPAITVAETQAKIDAITAASRGAYGYYVIDLKGDEVFGKNEDFSFTAASSIKVPFAIYLYSLIEKGTLSPEKQWTYISSDYEEGTGSLIASPFGTKLTVFRTVQLMITKSDNAATNMVTRYLGRSNIQKYWNEKGVTGVVVVQNKITPKAAATILAGLYDGKYLGKTSTDVIVDHMKKSITPERIVAGVPVGVPVAHKIGTNGGAISDTAIIYHPDDPYVLVVYSDKAIGETEPSATIASISKAVYEHFDSK